MKRMIKILAMAALASAVTIGAADARGGGGGGHGGGFGGGHMGGFGGGAHFGGGFGGGIHAGGFGGGVGHVASGAHFGGTGLRQHAFHQYGHYRPYGYGFGGYDNCYDWYQRYPYSARPLYCG